MFKFDEREFDNNSSFAYYLRTNFKRSLLYLSDGSLFNVLKNEFLALYEQVLELSKDFEHKALEIHF